MDLVLEAVLLGLLQGLTEFLPISSSGHVAIGMHLLGWDPGGNLGVLVAVHLGSLGAVLVFTIREALKERGIRADDATASVQGFGNVAQHAIQMFGRIGGRTTCVAWWSTIPLWPGLSRR